MNDSVPQLAKSENDFHRASVVPSVLGSTFLDTRGMRGTIRIDERG